MSIRLAGSSSGYTELDAGAVAGNNTLKMPTSNGAANQLLRNGATPGTLEFGGAIVSGTAQASTSGTSIDFAGIPSWVKRVTVMFSGVSTNGNNPLLVQVGSGSISTSAYSAAGGAFNYANVTAGTTSSVGFCIFNNSTYLVSGHMVLTLLSGTTWVSSHAVYSGPSGSGGGVVTLAGALDRLRIIGSTTGSPTDTFDAGTINILYE